MTTFDWQGCFAPLLDDLDSLGLERWRKQLQQQLQKRFDDNPHGDIARWNRALDTLPHIGDATANLNQSAITLNTGQPLSTEDRAKLEEGLRGLMPWRKGPFEFFGTYIDTEWRSDWKWDRVAPYLSDLSGRQILDVGCGSGYHCWRMLGEGAGRVKHLEVRQLWLQGHVKSGHVRFTKISRNINMADTLTKHWAGEAWGHFSRAGFRIF